MSTQRARSYGRMAIGTVIGIAVLGVGFWWLAPPPLKQWVSRIVALAMSGLMGVQGAAVPARDAAAAVAAPGAAAITSGLPMVMPPPPPSTEAATSEAEAAYAEVNRLVARASEVPAGDLPAQIDAAFDELEEAGKRLPRESFDPAAIVARVGNDPNALFRWVRDETSYVPYRGALRGPIGVLQDRVGNAADRALLLIELLSKAGEQARLVRGTLDEAAAQRVVERWRTGAPRAGPAAAEPPAPGSDAAVTSVVDRDALSAVRDRWTAATAKLTATTQERTAAQTAALLKALGTLAVTDPAADARATEVKEHWWVQWRNGGTWIDLDPTFSDAEAGVALTAPAQTLQPSQLRRDQMHVVTLRVVAEFLNAKGALEEHTLVEHAVAPYRVQGEPIVVTNVPMHWPEKLDLAAAGDPIAKLRETVIAQNEWMPVISVGARPVARYSITDQGELLDMTDPHVLTTRLARTIDRTTQKVGQATSLFETLPGGPVADPNRKARVVRKPGRLTAEWLEYEVRAPGAEPRRIRRALYDALGEAARADRRLDLAADTPESKLRRGLSLLEETEVLLLPYRPTEEFAVNVTISKLLKLRQPLKAMATGGDADKATDAIAGLRPVSSELLSLAVARHRWSRVAAETYVDAVNVLAHYKRLRVDPSRAVLQKGFDVVANAVAVRPEAAARAYAIRLEQGVLDTNAEAALIRCSGAADGRCDARDNAAESFAASAAAQVAWVAVRTRDELAKAQLDLPADARARISQDLDRRHAVLVPVRHVERGTGGGVTWWRVDQQTGTTIGVGGNGRGNVYAEFLIMARMSIAASATIACTVGAIAGGALGGLSVGESIVGTGICLAVGYFGMGSLFLSLIKGPAVLAQGMGLMGGIIALIGSMLAIERLTRHRR